MSCPDDPIKTIRTIMASFGYPMDQVADADIEKAAVSLRCAVAQFGFRYDRVAEAMKYFA